MNEAWRRPKEGTREEHEECFFVLQRRNLGSRAVKGKPDYYTDILWQEPGALDSCGGKHPPPDGADPRAVAQFHTHPGPAGDPSYANESYSEADLHASETSGLPSLVGYGEGSDPTKMKLFAVFPLEAPDRTRPRRKGWQCPEPTPKSTRRTRRRRCRRR